MAKNRISQLQMRDEQQPVRLCFSLLPLCAACGGHARPSACASCTAEVMVCWQCGRRLRRISRHKQVQSANAVSSQRARGMHRARTRKRQLLGQKAEEHSRARSFDGRTSCR